MTGIVEMKIGPENFVGILTYNPHCLRVLNFTEHLVEGDLSEIEVKKKL